MKKTWQVTKAVEDNVWRIVDNNGTQVARFTNPNAQANAELAQQAPALESANAALFEALNKSNSLLARSKRIIQQGSVPHTIETDLETQYWANDDILTALKAVSK